MRRKSTPKIVGRADIDVAVAEFKEIDVPQARSPYAPDASGDTLRPVGLRVACHPKPDRAKGGGAGGIRTLDRALQPYNGLANRRLQPLGHSSIEADMPDAGASRKRQIPCCLIRSHLATRGLLSELSTESLKLARHICYARITNASRIRQREPQEFFQRRFALPFRDAAAPAAGIREMMMLGNSETTAAQDPIDASA